MKKIICKILLLTLAAGFAVVVCIFANGFFGNPVSRLLAQKAVDRYLAAQYAGTDYQVQRLGYNFKFGCYFAHIQSASSIDTRFSLSVDMAGNVYADTYADVTSGAVTARRLEEAYRQLTAGVLQDPAFPYAGDIRFGTLEIYPQQALDDPLVTDAPAYALVQQELIPDHEYDILQLGRQAGHVIVYVDSSTVTVDMAADILLDIRARFDAANIPFRAIDLTLRHPLPADAPRPKEYIGVDHFAYADIVPEGLAERVAAADTALKAQLDAEK